MNDGGEDRILDSFLEEMLTNQHPPDLTELIQQRLRDELGAEGHQLRSSRRNGKTTPVKSLTRTVSPWASLSVAALTLAAGLMLAFALWKYWPTNSTPSNDLTIRPPVTKAEPISPSVPQVVEAPKAKELPPPFGIDAPLPEIPNRPAAAAPVAAMDENAIVNWIDERFAKLWESQGLQSSGQVDKERWLALVASRLSGTESSISSDSPRVLSEKLVRSVSFAEQFANLTVDYWLKGTAEADPQHSAGKGLRSYLANQIVSKKPWNEVLSSLIGSTPEEPQSVLLASLAGGGNDRLVSRIGSVMLDEALACARCHDASDNGRIVSMDQDDYWSLVAIFYGIDGKTLKAEQGAAPVRRLVDSQSLLFEGAKLPGVYFDRPDGRVQAARYRLPGGDDWRVMEEVQTPRASLARWINRSSITDQAAVNLAWRVVFGRPLVAQHAALDGEGYTQRREILALLAEQFQAHNRDMGQLVTWLVSSRPFAQDTLAIDRSRWLTATEDEIVHWSTAAANFAIRLPSGDTDKPVKSLESALARIDKWAGSNDNRRSTLGQLTPKSLTIPKDAIKANENEPLAAYLIHSVKPTHAQSLFINRLVKSKLSWQRQVDHIAGLVGEPAGNARLHSDAQKILDAKDGDRAAALFQLLQGALLCHEAM